MSSFQIPEMVVPAGASYKDYEVNLNDDFHNPPRPQKYSITKKNHHENSSNSPVKKKLKQQHKGLDEQSLKRNPPPCVAKNLSVRTPIFKPIQPKDKLASKRKDINRPTSKKSILIQSPDLFLSNSEDEDVVVTKKVT
ncbi:hypothetical protein FXO37_35788 [Capsicum annuum]|nr:hypothetical protein FXO37_35788 [Capsicum annuum]